MRKLVTFIFVFICLTSFAQSKLYPVAFNGKWGIVNEQKEFVCKPIYSYIEYVPITNSYIYYLNNKKGILDENGKKITEPIYTNIILFDSVYLSSFENEKWNLFTKNKVILPHEFQEIRKLKHHIFFALKNKNSIVINTLTNQRINGNFIDCKYRDSIIITQQFDKTYSFYNTETFEQTETNILSFSEIGSLIIIKKKNSEQLFNPKSNRLLGQKMDKIKQIKTDFFFGSLASNNYLYQVSTNKLFNLSNIQEIERINYPYVVYKKGNYSGVFHLLKSKGIITPKFDNINFTNNGFMVSNLNRYGYYNKKGKEILPCIFSDFNFYDYFIVVNQNEKYGLYSISGQKIESVKYNNINIFESSVKCYQTKSLLVIKYNKNTGDIHSKNKYDNYMTVTIGKQKLPKQKFEDLKFGKDDSQKSNQTLNEKYGWFRPIRTRKVKDSVQEFFGPWGLKDENDSVRIRPLFGYVTVFPKYNLTKCYFNKKASNLKYTIRINLVENSTVSFRYPFILVDQANKKILSKQKFHYLNLNDFDNYVLARGFTTVPVLVDSNANIIYDSLTFYDDYNENIIRICKNGKRVFSDKYLSTNVSSSYYFVKNMGAIKTDIPYKKSNLSIDNANWYFIDANGKQLNDTAFQFAYNFKNNRAIVKKNNKWGVIDTTMKTIIPFVYDYVDRILLNDSIYFKVGNSTNQNYMYNHYNGDLVKTNISKLGDFYKGVWTYQVNGSNRWGLIDTSKHKICDVKYDKIFKFNNNRAVAVKRGLKTIIDKKGNELIPYYKTKKITFLNNEDYALKMKKGVLILNSSADTLISNKKCKEILDWNNKYIVYKDFRNIINLYCYKSIIKLPKHTKIISYSLKDEILLLIKKNKMMLYDLRQKKYINKKLRNIVNLGEGCMVYKTNRLFGYMTFNGDTLTQAVYKELNPIKNGWAYAKKGNKRMIIDKKGNPLFDFLVFRVRPMGENYLISTKTGTGLITKDCKILIQPVYGKIYRYNTIFYKALNKNNKYDLFNLKGEKINDKPFDNIKAISTKNMVVKYDRFEYLYNGFIDNRLSFQNITPFSSSLFILKESYKYGVYDSNGNINVPVRYHRINLINDNFQVRFFNSFGFYKQSGKVIFDPFTL